jgi:Protein of unknown function (DUF1579)
VSPTLRAATVAALGLLAAPAAAQDRRPDPQSSVEPRSGPGAGQEFLARFVGDWDVSKTFHGRTGTAATSKGTCKQTLIHAGRFLRSEFVFEQDGRKSTGTGLIGFEPATGKFTSVWIDSRQTRMSMRQSKDKFDGSEIVLFAAGLEGGGEARKSRTLTKLEDNDNKIVHRQYSVGGDGPERLVMELVMTKKAVPTK